MELYPGDNVIFNHNAQWNRSYKEYPAIIVKQNSKDHYVLRVSQEDDPGGLLRHTLNRGTKGDYFEFICWEKFFTLISEGMDVHPNIEFLI